MPLCLEKEWRYTKLNRVLKEFDSTQKEIERPSSKIDCLFAEFSRSHSNIQFRVESSQIHLALC